MSPWDTTEMLKWAKSAFEEWNIEPFNNPSLSSYLRAYAESPTVVGTEDSAVLNLGYVLKLMRLCELSANYSPHYQAAFHEDIVQYFMDTYKEPWLTFSICVKKPGTFFTRRLAVDSGSVYDYLTNTTDIAVTQGNADVIYWDLLIVVFCARMFEAAHKTKAQSPDDTVNQWLSAIGNAFERSTVARCLVAFEHYQHSKFIEDGGLDGKFDGTTLELMAKSGYQKGLRIIDSVADMDWLRRHLVDTYKGTDLAGAFSTIPEPRLYRTMFTNYRENIRVFADLKKQKYVDLMGQNLYWVLMCNNFGDNLRDLCSLALLVDECLKLPKTTSHSMTMFCMWLLVDLIPAWSRVLATNADGDVIRSSHQQIKALISDVLQKTRLSGQDDGTIDELTQQAWAIVDTLGAGKQANDFASFTKMNDIGVQSVGGKLDAKLLSSKEENWGVLSPNSTVRKTYQFQNTGSVTWPANLVLGFVGNNYRLAGAYGDADTLVQATGIMAKEPVTPGKIVDMSVDIRVPIADPVGYYGSLGFRGPDGPFGDRIKISFRSGQPKATKQSDATQEYLEKQPQAVTAAETQQIVKEAQQVAQEAQQQAEVAQQIADAVDTKEAQQVAKQAQKEADKTQELAEVAQQVAKTQQTVDEAKQIAIEAQKQVAVTQQVAKEAQQVAAVTDTKQSQQEAKQAQKDADVAQQIAKEAQTVAIEMQQAVENDVKEIQKDIANAQQVQQKSTQNNQVEQIAMAVLSKLRECKVVHF